MNANDKHGVRLNKALAQAGVCSRRKADEMVFAGRVEVDGTVAGSPALRVDPAAQEIRVDGVPLDPTQDRKPTYLVLNKPIEVVSTVSDPQGRRTVLDLVPKPLRRPRLYPAGRLDYYSEGLLLLTDDGDLTYRLTHPSHHLAKVYELRTRGEVKPGWLQAARDGMRLTDKGEDLAPVRVEVKDVADGVSTMHLTLTQGVNRQIRRMCAEGDLTVLRLVRLRQGPLGLGDLQSGAVRVPAASEINALRQAVGL